MKKLFQPLAIISLLSILSCSNGSGGGGGGGGSPSQPSQSSSSGPINKTITINSENKMAGVSSDVTTLTVNLADSSLQGKSIYLAKVNNTSVSVANYSISYVTSVSGITKPATGSSADISRNAELISDTEESDGICCTPFLSERHEEVSERAGSNRSLDVTPTNYNVGDSKIIKLPKDIDNTGSFDLEFILKKKSAHAYLWIPKGTTKDTYTESYFTDTLEENFITKFESIYELMRTVFGEEPNQMYLDSNTKNKVSLDTSCDTGNMINIVFYDMISLSNASNVNGFFDKSNFFADKNYSSNGKFIYMNSRFAVENTNSIILSIAHEFTHMIHFNQKIMKRTSPLTWTTTYTEMLGDLAKDLCAEYFQIGDTENAKTRFKVFNTAYTDVGITGHDNSVKYYANNFAFGAWLCRNYGGAELAKEIMANDYDGDTSIAAAVNKLNNTNFTINDLISQFVQAITIPDSKYTMNKDVEASELSYNGYKYKQTAINVFDTSSYWSTPPTNILEKFCRNGPVLLPAYSKTYSSPFTNYGNQLQSNHGVTLHKLGKIQAGATSLTINFSTGGDKTLTYYIIVGDDRKMYGEN